MCELQQGAEITLSVDGGTWEIVSIPRYSEPIPVIDDSDLGTTGQREKCPGVLGDPQLMTGFVLRSVGTALYPTKGTVQTLTITHATVGTNTGRESFAGTGFVVDIRTPEFTSDTEARKTIEFDWQFDGKTGPTRTRAVAAGV